MRVTGKRVLIADDHPVLRGIMRSRLENQGFEVSEAANGAEAVHKAEEVKPDLVVLDLAMPVMNGLEAARILKRLFARSSASYVHEQRRFDFGARGALVRHLRCLQ
jgi:CheY-like chemotaxis protein